MDLYEENIQRLNRLRKRLFKIEARPFDVEKATLSSQLQAAVKLYSESLEQQAALKAVLHHYSSTQAQDNEQDLLREIWNGQDPAMEQQLASRRNLHLVQQIIDLRANYEAEKAKRVSVERDLKVAQELLADSQKEVDELRSMLAQNAATSIGSPSPLKSRSPLFPAEGDADSEIATAKKLIRDHIRSVIPIPSDRAVSSPMTHIVTQAFSPPPSAVEATGSGLPPKDPASLRSRRKHYVDNSSPGVPPPPPPPEEDDFGQLMDADYLRNLSSTHAANQDEYSIHRQQPPPATILQSSSHTPIEAPVPVPVSDTTAGIELDIDLGHGVSASIFIGPHSDLKRLATDFLRSHNLPASTYFNPLLSFLSATQASLATSAAEEIEIDAAPPAVEYSGHARDPSRFSNPSSSPDFIGGNKAQPHRSPPPPPPSSSSSPLSLSPPTTASPAAKAPSNSNSNARSRDGVRHSPPNKQADLRLLPVLDKPLSKQRSPQPQSPQRMSDSFEASPTADRDRDVDRYRDADRYRDGGRIKSETEARRLRTASIREQVGRYTMQLQNADNKDDLDGFGIETNVNIEDRREKMFQAVHTFDKAALCNERNQYSQAIKLYRQSVELFESAGFSTHGLQMVKEEVDYWTKKFARSY